MNLTKIDATSKGQKVALSPLGHSHIDELYENWGKDPKTFETLSSQAIDTREKVSKVISSSTTRKMNGELIRFAILDLNTKEAIGILTLTPKSGKNMEIGYSLGSSSWGKGFATEAVHLAIEKIKELKEPIDLVATIYEGNDASIRVLEKNGLINRGIMKRSLIYGKDTVNPDTLMTLMHREISFDKENLPEKSY